MDFEELAEKVTPKLRGITHRLNGRFTFFNEEDLYQEALMKLWLDYRDGKLSDKTSSYILQGCYFHLKNYIRKTADKAQIIRMDRFCDEDQDRDPILSLEDPRLVFEEMEVEILTAEILNDGLTAREKEVFAFSLQDMTTREIGKMLGISHVRVIKLKNSIKDKCHRFKEF